MNRLHARPPIRTWHSIPCSLLLTLIPLSAVAAPLPEVVGRCRHATLPDPCTSFGDDGDPGSPAGLQPCPAGLACCDTDGADDRLFTSDDDFCEPVNKPDWIGMYTQRDTTGSRQRNPGVRGKFVQTEWHNLEADAPDSNELGRNFGGLSVLQQQLDAAYANGQYAFVKVFYGNTAPSFLLSGVAPPGSNVLCPDPRTIPPAQLTSTPCNGKIPTLNGAPILLSNNYRFYYYRAVARVMEFLAAQPPEKRALLVAVQATTSNSGDPNANPRIDPNGVINNSNAGETWNNRCHDDVTPGTPTSCNPGMGACAGDPGVPCSYDGECGDGGLCEYTPTNPLGADYNFAGNSVAPKWWKDWTESAWDWHAAQLSRHAGLSHVRLILNPQIAFDGFEWSLDTDRYPCQITKAPFIHQGYDLGGEWREPQGTCAVGGAPCSIVGWPDGRSTCANGSACKLTVIGNQQWQAGQVLRAFRPDGKDVRARGEYGPTFRAGYESAWLWQAPASQHYWSLLFFLTYGLDVPDYHRGTGLGEYPNFWDNFSEDDACSGTNGRWSASGVDSKGNLCAQTGASNRFFTKYSGFKSAADSLGAFVAFRQPLDSSDLTTWPSSYGTAISVARELAILTRSDCPTCDPSIDSPAERGAFAEPGHAITGVMADHMSHKFAEGFCSNATGVRSCSTIGGASPQWTDQAPIATSHECSAYDGPDNLCAEWEGIQDIGPYDRYPSDYGMFLTVLNPRDTIGWWRLGWKDSAANHRHHANWPLDRNQPYGRYARSFRPGATQIRLGLDDAFWHGRTTGLDGAYPVAARVVYYDDNLGGRWRLCYHGTQGATCLPTQTNAGGSDVRFRDYTATISDLDGNNGGPGGADLWLEKLGDVDTRFHLVEINRTTGFRVGYFGTCEAAKGRGVTCPEGAPCEPGSGDDDPLPGTPPAAPNLKRSDKR